MNWCIDDVAEYEIGDLAEAVLLYTAVVNLHFHHQLPISTSLFDF